MPDNDPGLIPQLRQQLRNYNALADRRGETGADNSYESGIALGLEIALEAATGVRGAQKLVDDLEPGDRVWTSGIDSGYWHIVDSTSPGRVRCPAVAGAFHDVVHIGFVDGSGLSVQTGFSVRVAADDCAHAVHGVEAMSLGDAVSAWANGASQ